MTVTNAPIIIATHNGGYHADDVFAVATLSLVLERRGKEFQVVRTRDESVIHQADIVVDVGGVYDSSNQRFDHHMTGGAGERENGIPYAAFGLVWQHYGPELAEDKEIWERLDSKLVQPIDAVDNGVSIAESLHDDLYPYTIHGVLSAFQPAWKEGGEEHMDQAFIRVVDLAKEILTRELAHISGNMQAEQVIVSGYETAEDKRLIILDEVLERSVVVGVLTRFTEPLLAIYKHRSGDWHIVTCRSSMDSFESRISLPEAWGGLTGEALEQAAGVPGATFCHPKLFLCGADTKKTAIELATAAL